MRTSEEESLARLSLATLLLESKLDCKRTALAPPRFTPPARDHRTLACNHICKALQNHAIFLGKAFLRSRLAVDDTDGPDWERRRRFRHGQRRLHAGRELGEGGGEMDSSGGEERDGASFASVRLQESQLVTPKESSTRTFCLKRQSARASSITKQSSFWMRCIASWSSGSSRNGEYTAFPV